MINIFKNEKKNIFDILSSALSQIIARNNFLPQQLAHSASMFCKNHKKSGIGKKN